MAYLLDANVFIQAKNLHYGFDFCPAFWDWIEAENVSGSVMSIDRIRNELMGGDDELATWAHDRPGFFVEADPTMLPQLQEVSRWASGAGYEPAAIATFLQVADYYLVASALAHGHTVVTHEVVAHGAKRIKIPNACLALGARCITPFEMLRRERARFVLGAATA
jgi:hypothetical protein